METSPEIDRARLERYPLNTHPAFILVTLSFSFTMMILMLTFTTSFVVPFLELGPRATFTTQLLGFLFGSPWLAFVVGPLAGAAGAKMFGSRRHKQFQRSVDIYFLKQRDRLRKVMTREYLRPDLRMLSRIFALIIAVGIVCAAIKTSGLIALMLATFVYVLLTARAITDFHREIVRRRTIALAWEGRDVTGERLATNQKAGIVLLVAVASVFVVALAAMTLSPDTRSLVTWLRGHTQFEGGANITADEAANMERRLIARPNDLDTRIRLIGHHFHRWHAAESRHDPGTAAAHMQRMRTHTGLLIEQAPGHPYVQHIRIAAPYNPNDPAYPAFADLWRNKVDQFPNDPAVLWNAAEFFNDKDDKYCKELLQRGQALEPDEVRWTTELNKLRLKADQQPVIPSEAEGSTSANK